MLKGTNEIKVNQATMQEIVQYWFDEVLFKNRGSVVQKVYMEKEGMTKMFVIELSTGDTPETTS